MDLITDKSEFDIRYSKPEEQTYLKQWMLSDDVIRWYPVSSEKDVDDMTKNWIGFYRYGASLTAFYKEEPIGIATLFLMPYRKLIQHCMVYFIVNPDFYRRGVGTALIRNVTHLAKTYFRIESIHIEIFEGCPAIPILEKCGYHSLFTQEHFVKEGKGRYLARMLFEKDLVKEGANG